MPPAVTVLTMTVSNTATLPMTRAATAASWHALGVVLVLVLVVLGVGIIVQVVLDLRFDNRSRDSWSTRELGLQPLKIGLRTAVLQLTGNLGLFCLSPAAPLGSTPSFGANAPTRVWTELRSGNCAPVDTDSTCSRRGPKPDHPPPGGSGPPRTDI